jgi:hypothetical protein
MRSQFNNPSTRALARLARKLSATMAVVEGTSRLKVWRGSYSFAVDGGAISTFTMRSNDGDIPIGSIVLGGFLDVATLLASGGAATVAVQVEAANDLQTAITVAGAPWSTTGRKVITPVLSTPSTYIKTTAVRNPKIVIAAFTVTAGVFDLVLFYL